MLLEYIPMIIMIVLAFVVAFIFLLGSKYLGAKRETVWKDTTYESGMIPKGTARSRFSIKFYMIAVSFIVFDLEVVFMYPWAVTFGRMGLVSFFTMLTFIIILFIGYYYEYRKGGLQWD